jgi:uncharacterized protein (DUF433 family)
LVSDAGAVVVVAKGGVLGGLVSGAVVDGASIDQFVEWFPGVTLEQARSVLEYVARNTLTAA